MPRIRLFYFFSITLFWVLIDCNTCTKDCVLAGVKAPIKETTDPAFAERIFADYGAGVRVNSCGILNAKRFDHICENVDSKTNFIYGDAICSKAAKKLYGWNTKMAPRRVKCVYKDVFKTCENYNEYTKLTCHAYMAQCEYLLNDSVETFYAFNGPKKDFYYISKLLEDQVVTDVIAFLYIKIQKNDFPTVGVKETFDSYEADNIFGVWGQKDEKLFSKHNDRSTRKNLCELAKNSAKLIKKSKLEQIKIENVQFIEGSISRKKSDYPHSKLKQTSKLPIIRCVYHALEFAGQFLLLSGPTDELYYIGTQSKGQLIWIQAVVELVKIEKKRSSKKGSNFGTNEKISAALIDH